MGEMAAVGARVRLGDGPFDLDRGWAKEFVNCIEKKSRQYKGKDTSAGQSYQPSDLYTCTSASDNEINCTVCTW